MTTVTVRPNQSMLDVIIQGCGSLEAGMQFCVDNDVAISDVPGVGAVYVVSDAALALAGTAGAAVLAYLAKNNLVVGTLALMPVVEVPLMNDDGVQDLLNDNGAGLDADQ